MRKYNVFQMTKIDGRTKKAAARQIDESLARLQTDYIDLVQHHAIIRMEDPDSIFKEDGAMAAFLEARLKSATTGTLPPKIRSQSSNSSGGLI
jgi:aryl-alcohol dehydrogenase-like predicted oxidoreductase